MPLPAAVRSAASNSRKRRTKAAWLRGVLVATTLALAAPAPVRADYTATVIPASLLVTNFDGWGTSLCWWANVVGGYANRGTYMTLAFTQLKLNIVRYNIGGGSNPNGDFITNYRAVMQGFEPSNGVWNWNADANQLWVLREAVALGANRVVAFANSPPWWMTVSGSVTGNGSSGSATDNLQTGYEDAFAVYLATVVSNLTVLDGVHFDYVTPVNEPAESWWYYTDPKQEGCHMDASQQARVVNYLRAELSARGLTNAGIDAPEGYSESHGISDLTTYSSAVSNATLLTTHTYSPNNPSGLHSAAVSLGRPAWVSEYGDGATDGMAMAQRIHDDITGLGARAWIYWQFVDNAGGWGCLYNQLNTNSDGSFTTSYTINEKFYVMGQFSEFIRPGCNIIPVDDASTLAAYNPANSTLVLVMINTNTASLNVTYNLGAFTSLPARAAAYQTDSSENLAQLVPVAVSGGQFTAAIPAQSVTTFVLTNATLAPMLASQTAGFATNNVALYAGTSPHFTIAAIGSGPLWYRWLSNNVPVAGATNATYFPPAGAVGTNNYYCLVTNIAGAATSAVWSVAVTPPPVASYPQAVLALHPLGYWRLNETPDNGGGNQGAVCHDCAGGINGVYSNVVLAAAGYSPVADPAATAATFGSFRPTNSAVTQIGAIDFSAPSGGNAEFSLTAWVKGGAQTCDAGIVAKGYGGGGEQFNLDTGSDSVATHGFRFFVRDAFGNTHACNSTIMPGGNWHFLAAVCDQSNGAVRLFIDGVDSADGTIAPGTALLFAPAGSAPPAALVSIGSRAAGKSSISLTNQFAGTIDEVAVFNYALSSSQIHALFAAAPVPGIRLAPSGGGMTINYTGTLLSATNVAGPYTTVAGAASPFAITPTAPRLFYRVSNP